MSVRDSRLSLISPFPILPLTVAAVGTLNAVEITLWCRAYNAPLYVVGPSANASLLKKMIDQHKPRVNHHTLPPRTL